MRVTFVLPGYFAMPIGGYRVVYEYADYLAARGHAVTIVFPKHPAGFGNLGLVEAVKKRLWNLKTRLRNRPLVPWHSLHPDIKLALVPTVQDRFIPDGDITVATGWRTARPVADLSQTKGAKFYLIQHHETWDGPEEEVNATWRLPLHKIVISRWLLELGGQLGASELRHIPNGIDTRRFHIITPPEMRRMSILSLYHSETFKGLTDALAVLRNYHEHYPDVPVAMFGAQPRGSDVPDWMQYVANPKQDALVRDIYNQHAVYFGAKSRGRMGAAPAEGMACGCAFVGTDIGGFRDYAIHDDTALLSPPGDREGLLRNLTMITENTALRSRIQRRVRRISSSSRGPQPEAPWRITFRNTFKPAPPVTR